MDQRWLFSTLVLEFSILLWPWFLLGSGAVTVFLAEISLPLAILSLSMTVIGVWGKRTVQLRPSQLLAPLSIAALPVSWLSMGYFIGAGQWALTDCIYLNSWKCALVEAASYANLYLVVVLLVPIVLLVCGLGAIVSLDNTGVDQKSSEA